MTAASRARFLIRTCRPSYPLDLGAFSACLGLDKPVRFHARPLPGEISALAYDRDWFSAVHIVTNSQHPVTRQRFGGAHELGHLYLGHRGCLSLYSPAGPYAEDPVEHAEADAFATEVLMPGQLVADLAGQFPGPLALVSAVQRHCLVSLEAAARRVVELEVYGASACIYLRGRETRFFYCSEGTGLSWQRVVEVHHIARQFSAGARFRLSFDDCQAYLHKRRGGLFVMFTEVAVCTSYATL